MAAPRNLSFHSNLTSSSSQSLQTPDASSLLLQANTDSPSRVVGGDCGFESLEDLLNDAGVTTAEGQQSPEQLDISHNSNKRPLDDPVFPATVKKPKIDEQSVGVSAGLQRLSNPVVPSILSYSSSTNSHVTLANATLRSDSTVAGSLSLGAGASSIPLVNPATLPTQSSANSSATLLTNNVGVNSSVANIASLLGNQPPLALGSISLLVQLYKQFQNQGNLQGMQKIKDQLSILQSQLLNKSKTLTGQTGLTGTINITPPSFTGSLSVNNFQPVHIPSLNSNTQGRTTPPTPSSSSQQQSQYNGPSIVTNGITARPHSNNTSNNNSFVPPPSILQSTSTPNSNPLSGSVSSAVANNVLGSGLLKLQTTAIPSSTSRGPQVPVPSFSTTSSLASSAASANITPHNQNQISNAVLSLPSGGAANLSVTTATASSLNQLPPSLPPVTMTAPISIPGANTTSSTSPSFVTHMVPSSAQLPLGLQVTPQTQANVLKAVYSYRLQQIQEFLSSLPQSQKPTTTQELRELLIKNNVLSKALPADFLTQLQKMTPQIQQGAIGGSVSAGSSLLDTSSLGMATTLSQDEHVTSGTVNQSASSVLPTVPSSTTAAVGSPPPMSVNTTTAHVLSSTGSTVSTTATVGTNSGGTVGTAPSSAPRSSSLPVLPPSLTTTSATSLPNSSITSSVPPQVGNNASLPGVTLETLKTLCRLPEADFIRIPMPAMLMTIVHFLRSNKWTGNSADLPGLLKQAQDALSKNTLANVTPPAPPPAPSVVQALKIPSTQPALVNSKSVKSSDGATGGTNKSSPLSQLMASFGMKSTPTINHITNSSSSLSSSTTTKSSVTNHPVTRQQTKAYQEQLEREKIANLQKLLQSSEEARIAFRFKAHVEKLNQQLLSPDIKRPFTNWQDLILRLLPYHVYREPELPPGAMEKADAVYEGIAGVLLSRAQGLMSKYQQFVVNDQKESSEDRAAGIVLKRLWLETERERQEEEEKQRKEAEEIAAELSVVGGGMMNDSFLDTDPFLLESDSYDDDPFLSQIWASDSGFMGAGQPMTDFSSNTGIT